MRPGPEGFGWLRVTPGGRLELSGPHFAPTTPGMRDRGTGLTAVAVQEDNSDLVEVRLVSGTRILQVLLNHEVLSFAEQNWMDLKGEWDGQTMSVSCPHSLSLPPGPPHLSQPWPETRMVSRAQVWRWRCLSLLQSNSQPLSAAPHCGRRHSGHAHPWLSVDRHGSRPPIASPAWRTCSDLEPSHPWSPETHTGQSPEMPGQWDESSPEPRGVGSCSASRSCPEC